MNKFEAETKKEFSIPSSSGLYTAKQFITYSINSSWHYSGHWECTNWVSQAKKDCITRLDEVSLELANLRKSLKLLESIEEENEE